MRSLFICIFSITILTSCSQKHPMVYENDTEPTEWIGNITIKERPNAHSGKSVSVIDSLSTYSFGFRKTIQDISSSNKIKKATISYWVYIKNANAKANTVSSVDFEGKNIDWQGRLISDKVKVFNKWVQVSETFTIPDKAQYKHTLSLYVWNISKEEILLDDFKITFN